MGDRFEEMRTFVAVAEAGGFAAAARRLGLVKSAVSRRVRELESRLGTKLMHRDTRRLHLTDAGQELRESAARLLGDLDEVESAVGAGDGELRGRLRVAAPVSFTTHCLARVLSRFVAAHPRLSLDVDTDDRLVDIIGDGFDLAIRITRLRDSALIARRIATIRHVCCASPALLARHGRPKRIEDLAALPGIRYCNVEENRYWSFAGGRAPTMRSQLSLANGDAIREAAVTGLGVAVLPTFIVHEAIRRGELEIILRDQMRPPIAMYAVFPSARTMPPRLRAFLDFLVASFGNEPFWDRELFSEEELRRMS